MQNLGSTTSQNSGNTLYSKYKHGSLQIDPKGVGSFEVTQTDGTRIMYTSKRSLISSFYEGRDLHIPFDRYFKLGKYAATWGPAPVMSIQEMFAGIPTRLQIEAVDPELGIDLRKRGHEVAKLFYSGFGQRVYREGFDPDDVLQEVYKGILSRNKGRCPFDPRKASFSHYVYMVISCVLSNYRRQITKSQGREIVVGLREELVREPDELELGEVPVSAVSDLQNWLMKNPHRGLPGIELAIQIVPLLYAGHTRKHIAEALGAKLFHVNQAVQYLRTYAKSWFKVNL
jgi:hypothetical protein